MDQQTANPVERTGPPLARIGLLGAVAAAIIAVGILAAGAWAAPGGTLAADNADTTGTTSGAAIDLAAGGHLFGNGPLGGHPGGMRGLHEITITSISGSRISLRTDDGWTRTIILDGGTIYEKDGAAIALSDLEVGDEVHFRQTREDDGSFTIDAVAVIPPHAGGKVTAVSGSTITVERRDGSSSTINVTSATTYDVAGRDAASLADITAGMVVMATGTENAVGSLTASAVHAFDPSALTAPDGHGFGPGGFGPGGFGPGGHGPWGDGTAPGASSGNDG